MVSQTCLATQFITDTISELGIERLGTLEELEIQYSQALVKSKARNNFPQQVIRSTYIQSNSHLSEQSAQ